MQSSPLSFFRSAAPCILSQDYVLNIGDSVGVRLPRACRNGLCGSCVCDVLEPNSTQQTIKACNTKLLAPSNGAEIVVDVYRLNGGDDDVMESSMKRFSDDWETQFVPDYKRDLGPSAPQSVASGPDYSKPEVWTTYERIRNSYEPTHGGTPWQDDKNDDDQDDDDEQHPPPRRPLYGNALADGIAPWEQIW